MYKEPRLVKKCLFEFSRQRQSDISFTNQDSLENLHRTVLGTLKRMLTFHISYGLGSIKLI